MNLSEFKSWFEGFTESMDGPPGEKAWKRIQDRIKSIKSDEPTTRHYFHEHYERPWRRWYNDGPWWSSMGYQSSSVGLNTMQTSALHSQASLTDQSVLLSQANAAANTQPFDSGMAFNKLGRAEALSLTHTKLKG